MAYWQPKPKIIRQRFPNQHISLYRGFAELINDNQIIEGKVFINISWYPSPNINCRFIYFGEDIFDMDNQDDLELKLTELVPSSNLKVCISNSIKLGNKKKQLLGHLREPYIQGNIDNLASVVFHIPNFWGFNISNIFNHEEKEDGFVAREGWLGFDGQFIFDYGNWHIVLATLDNCFDIEKILEAEGGYGVTHICKVEHLDNTSFALDEAYDIIQAFIYYLSFARGIWIAPLLVSGFDSEGNQVLEEWRNPIIEANSWQDGCSWANDDSTEIVAAFAGFMNKWEDPAWKDVIQNAIQWYIESLKHFNGYNTSIVLMQSALEKIAWAFLKIGEYVNSDGFNGLKAYGQIKLLLKILEIPLEPIEEYPEINKKAKELNWKDTVAAITEARNGIVHPPIKPSKSQIVSEAFMQEVFQISNTYLLNSLLKLFDFPYI